MNASITQKVDGIVTTLKLMMESGEGVKEFKPRKDFGRKLDLFLPKLSSLSLDQLVAVGEVLFGQYDCLTITGKAGTGKTHILKLIKEMLSELFDVNVLVVAPTGVAGQIAGGSTINSCGLGGGDYLPRGIREFGQGYNRPSIETRVRAAKPFIEGNDQLVVICDEAYATPCEYLVLYWQLCDLVRPGEVKFILMGDPGQLPAVDKQKPGSLKQVNPIWKTAKFVTKQGSEHVYGSMLTGPFPIEEGTKPHWRGRRLALTTNHRQKEDKSFVNALNYIRIGGKLEGPAAILLSRFMPRVQPINPETAIHIFASRRKVAEINELAVKQAKKRRAKTRVYKAICSGDVEKVDIFPAALEMELAVGLSFMVRQNMKDKGVYNGTIGIITELYEKSIVISVDGRNVELEYKDYPEDDIPKDVRGRPVASISMLPGHLGVGITGHKAQGLTIQKEVIVHLDPQNDSWLRHQPGAMYVILSRGESLDKLFIDSSPTFVNSLINADPEALAFIKESEEEMEEYGIEGVEEVTQEHLNKMMPVLVDKEEDEDGSCMYQFSIYHSDGESALIALGTKDSINSYIMVPDVRDSDNTYELNPVDCPYHVDCCRVLKITPMGEANIAGVVIKAEVAATCEHLEEVEASQPQVIKAEEQPAAELIKDDLINVKEGEILNESENHTPEDVLIKTDVVIKNGQPTLILNNIDVPLSPYILRARDDYRFLFGELLVEVTQTHPTHTIFTHSTNGLNKFVVEVIKTDEFAEYILNNPQRAQKFEEFIKTPSFAGLVLLEDRAAQVIKTDASVVHTPVPFIDDGFYANGDEPTISLEDISACLEPEDYEDEPLVKIGVVGTAGRNDDAARLNKSVYDAMYWELLNQLHDIPIEQRHLISGGASYADHLAVRAYLEGQCSKLTLHLPRGIENCKYVPYGDKAADAMNFYHKKFSERCFTGSSDSMADLMLAINKGAEFTTCGQEVYGYKPMFERNTKIARDGEGMLIAFTFGVLSDSGTKDTWDKHVDLNKSAKRVHVNINNLGAVINKPVAAIRR